MSFAALSVSKLYCVVNMTDCISLNLKSRKKFSYLFLSNSVFLGTGWFVDFTHENCLFQNTLIFHCSLYFPSGFGGLEVACWPLVPKFAGSNPAEAVGFLRVNKNPQYVGGHECLSVVIVVCCQVEVSATWSLVQRIPTDCGASLCVI